MTYNAVTASLVVTRENVAQGSDHDMFTAKASDLGLPSYMGQWPLRIGVGLEKSGGGLPYIGNGNPFYFMPHESGKVGVYRQSGPRAALLVIS